MTTQASAIIDAAIASSLANDAARTDLANDTTELLGVLSREVRRIYALAGMPREYGGFGRGDYFATTSNVVLGASPVALPAAAFRPLITFVGVPVAVVPQADLDDGSAELAPAVIIRQDKVGVTGRAGDPVATDTLVVSYTPLPGVLTLDTHYIGATDPADSATTQWPDWVGDPYLILFLARYLALKAGDRDTEEMAALDRDITAAGGVLAQLIGVAATQLTSMRETPRAA